MLSYVDILRRFDEFHALDALQMSGGDKRGSAYVHAKTVEFGYLCLDAFGRLVDRRRPRHR